MNVPSSRLPFRSSPHFDSSMDRKRRNEELYSHALNLAHLSSAAAASAPNSSRILSRQEQEYAIQQPMSKKPYNYTQGTPPASSSGVPLRLKRSISEANNPQRQQHTHQQSYPVTLMNRSHLHVSPSSWRAELADSDRVSLRQKLITAYSRHCNNSYDDLLDIASALEEEMLYLIGQSKNQYLDSGYTYPDRITRTAAAVAVTSNQKRRKITE